MNLDNLPTTINLKLFENYYRLYFKNKVSIDTFDVMKSLKYSELEITGAQSERKHINLNEDNWIHLSPH